MLMIATKPKRGRPPVAEPVTVAKMQRVLRKHVREVPGAAEASPYTVIKLRQAPIAKLIDEHKIGPEEMQAAQDIETAFFALSSRLMCKGMTLERIDRSGNSDAPWPARTAKAVGLYNAWATHWTKRANLYGDPMLQVVIAAVVDRRPLRGIAADLGYGLKRIEAAVIGGLRDFAVRSGLVTGHLAKRWSDAAEVVFVPQSAKLLDAVRRARIET